MTKFCFWEFWNSPSADRVHPVDSGDSEGLVFGAGQAVAERSQSQPLVVPTAGPLDHITHGLPVWRADGGGERERTLVQLFRHCSVREDALHNHISAIAYISLSVGNVFFVLFLPEISSSSTSDWKLLRFSQVGGEYFFRVTCWRPMVLFAVLTKFLDSVLEETAAQTFQSLEKSELCYV